MKTYKFDYIDEMVDAWSDKSNITMESLEMTPYCVFFGWLMPNKCRPATDYYGEVIEDFTDWHSQREEHLKTIYNKYKNEKPE